MNELNSEQSQPSLVTTIFHGMMYVLVFFVVMSIVIIAMPFAAIYYGIEVYLLPPIKLRWNSIRTWYYTLSDKEKREVYFWTILILLVLALIITCVCFGGKTQPSEFPVWLPAIM